MRSEFPGAGAKGISLALGSSVSRGPGRVETRPTWLSACAPSRTQRRPEVSPSQGPGPYTTAGPGGRRTARLITGFYRRLSRLLSPVGYEASHTAGRRHGRLSAAARMSKAAAGLFSSWGTAAGAGWSLHCPYKVLKITLNKGLYNTLTMVTFLTGL